VVGYAAIAFYEDEPGATPADSVEQGCSADEQQYLLGLARRSLTRAVRREPATAVEESEVPDRLRSLGACFVTLRKAGQLRGCIGHLFACRRLYQSVIENAASAALSDTRFAPLQSEELDELDVEISILTMPRRLEYASPEELLRKLRPGTDGVVLSLRGRRSTYLPQVWEHLPEKERFLSELSRKARLPADAWQDPEASVLTYQVTAFHGKYRS
jgi:AmmeMemoRadiSam system protein A